MVDEEVMFVLWSSCRKFQQLNGESCLARRSRVEMTYGQLRNDTICNNAFFRGTYLPVDLAPFDLHQEKITNCCSSTSSGLEQEDVRS